MFRILVDQDTGTSVTVDLVVMLRQIYFLSQEEVIHAVEKVCIYLPSSLSSQCKDLVDTYGQAIIALLVQQADPKTICTVLAVCNDARRAYVGKSVRFLNCYIKM